MSGGALDYVYGRVRDASETIASSRRDKPLYVAFAKLLERVAVALKAVEWEMSGDTSSEDSEQPLRDVVSAQEELAAAVDKADAAHKTLGELLVRVRGEVRE